jgi:hypothetical protein
MSSFFIAASDMDVIIGIIAVVGWILAQVFGKKKGDSPSQEESPPVAGPSLDPRDELRKFFEDLEKTAKPQAPPQPVAPPPLQHPPHREKPVRRSPEPRSETLSSQNRPAYSAAESALAFTERVTPPGLSPALVTPVRPPVFPELRDPLALRKYIVANEILGKPIALRQG